MNNKHSFVKTFPFEGEIFNPEYKKFEEIIVFVHWYGGHKQQMRRHIQFVNQLGFRAFAFNLFPQPFEGSRGVLTNPKTYSKTLLSRWSRQTLTALSYIQKEKKIIFGFSFGCNVITQIFSKISNITAIVFDGGPFSGILENSWRYLSYQEPVKNVFLRSLTLILWNLFCGFVSLRLKIHPALRKWPAGLPVLSFRAIEDRLVPPDSIDKVLKPHSHLNMTTALIPKVQHLQGMKFQPDLYKKALEEFLIKYGTPKVEQQK